MNGIALVLQAPDWQRLKARVLNSVSSPITRRVYNLGLNEFIAWYGEEPRRGLTKATVNAWRVALEARGLGPVSINVRMTAVRKLAAQALGNVPPAPEPGVPRELAPLLGLLPPGQRRVAMALIADNRSRTYPEVAAKLGVHLGTVHQHLRRIRRRHPKVYAAVMTVRDRQLGGRHQRALARETAHSKQWHEITKGWYLPIAGR